MNKRALCVVREAFRQMEAFQTAFSGRFGLDLSQALVLCALREQPGIGPGDVAGRLGLKASHTSKLLGKMEERNLIRRSLCKDDLRCMKFSLTKEGECLLREIEAENLEIPEFVLNLL
ncbi:MAG: MarR family transcriptional regulator [Bacteroidales bacterium]|nr:MarR family transcriptional regulator [Bacteroidales bacterium]